MCSTRFDDQGVGNAATTRMPELGCPRVVYITMLVLRAWNKRSLRNGPLLVRNIPYCSGSRVPQSATLTP